MNRRAFTLMELLVVVGIILVLMGILIPSVGMARRAAQRARTTAVVNAVAAAIDQYRSLNATYPERWVKPADAADPGRVAVETALSPPAYATALTQFQAIPDGTDCYAVVYSTNPADRAAPANPITTMDTDRWLGTNAVLAMQLGSLISDNAKDGLLLDTWGTPLRYRPSKWYPYGAAATPRIDSSEPPGQDSYQLWSAGIDKVDDPNPGEGGDDMPLWAKKTP